VACLSLALLVRDIVLYSVCNCRMWTWVGNWYTHESVPVVLEVLIFFFFPFAGVVPLATYMRIYKKGDIVDIKVS
jgi:hypothetical protein